MRHGWVLLLVAGCGRLGFDDEPGDNMMNGVDPMSALAPAQCEAAGPFATVPSANIDLAVATTPTGASLFWVPLGGGNLSGIDLAVDRTAGPITTIATGTFTESSAAYLDGHLLATGLSSSRSLVHDVPQPLAAGTQIGNFGGDHVAKRSLVHVGPDRVVATSCTDMQYHAFDASWTGQQGTYNYNSPQTDHVDITDVGARALTVVSTGTQCEYFVGTNKSTNTTRTSTTPCEAARLASDGADQIAMLVADTGYINMVIDATDTVNAQNAMTIGAGSGPRVLRYDNRFWISYVDTSGHIVIGFLDDTNTLVTRTLTDTATTAKGYELAMFDGSPWVFAVDSGTSNVTGRRLCAQ